MFPASDSFASIALPDGMSLVDSEQKVSLGTMGAGATATVTWLVHVDAKLTTKEITVTAGGIVSGQVPEASWNGQSVSYPPYDYADVIGGSATVGL